MQLSPKGLRLIELYAQMAKQGYDTAQGARVDAAFNDFELRAYRMDIQKILQDSHVTSVLDYGCGGSDWLQAGFDEATGQSAKDFFGLDEVYRYEPARDIDERQAVDCLISFDVLEHVYIADVANTIRDMLRCAKQIALINVACYPANARLPNGENAHITVRPPAWWKGMFDAIVPEFPAVKVWLACSTQWRQTSSFPMFSANLWDEQETFEINF